MCCPDATPILKADRGTSEVTVVFEQSGKTVRCDGSCSILELALAEGIAVNFGCRGGGCGLCKLVCVSGTVEATTSTEGLCPLDQEERMFLSCVSCPRGKKVVVRA